MNALRIGLLSALLWIPGLVTAQEEPSVEVSELSIQGEIEGENIVFRMAFKADVKTAGAKLALVVGDVAFLDYKLPRKAELTREGNRCLLSFPSRGSAAVALSFASRPIREATWRRTAFSIPLANVRRVSVVCDRDDLEIGFPGALSVEKTKNDKNRTVVTAYLGASPTFEVRWKPEIKKLDAELVVACEANTIATAGVGALRLDSMFTYRVVQGLLQKLTFEVPAGLNVTEVNGPDIQDWKLEDKGREGRLLVVTLSRAWENVYALQVKAEMSLAAFPCQFGLPALTPRQVIRTNGFLMTGTDSAIKLLVNKLSGLTQVDQAAFPMVGLDPLAKKPRALPSGNAFAYQYANMPYTLVLDADDIVPEYSADDRLILSVEDNDLVLNASVELEFRDAPAREVTLSTSPDWMVANVSGKAVSDYDVRDTTNSRTIRLYFHAGMIGRTLVDLRLERTLGKGQTNFAVPSFQVEGAKSERGTLVLTGEKGLRLKMEKLEGLREAHTGLSVAVPDAQQAYRFREAKWSATVTLERTEPTVYAEVFNLTSIGDGILYGSAAVTYRVNGAPARQFRFKIPAAFQNVEFSGKDVRGWTHEGEEWVVTLQEKVIGDYTLLVTYDQRLNYETADLSVGGIETLGTESEVGYLALASEASLSLKETGQDASLIRIDREEIPKSYALLLNDPVLAAYKYVRAPHQVSGRISRFRTEQLLDQILDYATLSTTLSEDGESVTTVSYFLKNTSQQYLRLKLPEGARLWTARQLGENGKGNDVSPLKGEDGTLIPVGRLRDPNSPLRLELTYAQSVRNIWPIGRRLTLKGPVSPDTPANFVKWTVVAPRGFSIAGQAGDTMAPESLAARTGLEQTAGRLLGLWSVFLSLPFRWLLLMTVLAVGVAVYGVTSRARLAPWLLVVLLVAAGILLTVNGRDCSRVNTSAMASMAEPSEISFTRSVNLAGDHPLSVTVHVAPRWMGAEASWFWVLILGVVGFVVAGKGGWDRNPWQSAIGLALLVMGAAGTAWGRLMLAFLFGLGLPAWLIGWFWIVCSRKGRVRRAAANDISDLDAPFEPAAAGETASEPPSPAAPTTPSAPSESGRQGSVRIGLACLIFAAMAVLGWVWAAEPTPTNAVKVMQQAPAVQPAVSRPVMTRVDLVVEGPGPAREGEKSAKISAEFVFSAREPQRFLLFQTNAVVTEFELGSKDLRLMNSPAGYWLDVSRPGEYRVSAQYRIPVEEKDGVWSLALGLPSNLKNRVMLRLPEKDLDVRSEEAVHLTTTDKGDKGTEIAAVFGPVPEARMTWRSRVRKAKLEQLVLFCEVNSRVTLQPGVVESTHWVRLQIAQGEIKAVSLAVPTGMSVTAVSAPELSTWRFDPETHQLDAVLERPVSGDFMLVVATQNPKEGLPYEAEIGPLAVKGAGRQRGAIAFAVPETVQIGVDTLAGLSAMNIADFPAAGSTISPQAAKDAAPVKRAFRYHELPASARVKAEKVLPELKVEENGSLSIADERIVLSTQLGITVAKSGIFSVRLDIPRDFEVESLSGEEVSHWDEVKDDHRGILVHFQKQAIGKRQLNLVVARMEKGIEDTITVPRVDVKDARKHTGTVVVSGERGVRLTTLKRDGVSELNPRDLGIRETGVLAFSLLRPGWVVTLKTEVLAPTLKPEVLQRIDLAEGVLRGTVHIRYVVENAGCKIFRLQAPQPGIPLAITGRNVAKVYETDKEKGVWQVDLHAKVEQPVLLKVSYQIPFDPAQREVRILPVRTLDTEGQKGYVAILSSGRVQVRPVGEAAGLTPEDARGIPTNFEAGDLSDAILCYRTVRPDYELPLTVLRHDSAEVLPAKINRVRLASVVSEDRQIMTSALLEMNTGELRFLKMTLPGRSDRLWSVQVNRKVARPARESPPPGAMAARGGAVYRIPLEASLPGETTSVEIVYAGRVDGTWFSRDNICRGPQFELPLNDVQWTLFVRADRRYYGFDGTMKFQGESAVSAGYDQNSYADLNKRQSQTDIDKARVVMARGEQFAREGRQQQARQALEAAMNYSQSERAFNEDARIQYRNLVKQQAFVGLVQRRNEVKSEQNLLDETQVRQMDGFRGGNFTKEFAQRVEQSLPAEETGSLQALAEKIVSQQAAASAAANAIRVTVPEHGTRLAFHRPLQINADDEMVVSFKSKEARWGHRLLTAFIAVILLAFLRFLTGRWMKPDVKAGESNETVSR